MAIALPAAGPVLVGGVKALLNYYEQAKTNETLRGLQSSVGQLYTWENFAWNVVSDVFGAAKGGEAISQGVSHDAGVKIEAIGRYVKDITEHTYNTVIPHSLSWLYGYIESHDLVPLRRRLGRDESMLRFLMGWRGQVDNWKNHYVNPQLAKDAAFIKWFDGWPLQVVSRWHEWFMHPGQFGDWATPYIVVPFVKAMATKPDQKSRDALALIMVRAWQDQPELTLDAIAAWLVSE